jgi:hypothetical protein
LAQGIRRRTVTAPSGNNPSQPPTYHSIWEKSRNTSYSCINFDCPAAVSRFYSALARRATMSSAILPVNS